MTNIITSITRVAGRGGLLAMKHAPKILMIMGTTGVAVGTVLACGATLKVDGVIEELETQKAKIKQAREELTEVYSENDYRKDMTIAHAQAIFKLVKLYGPAILIMGGSIACFWGSHNVLNKRNLAIAAAYKALDESFKDYRNRVVEELGADKDRQFRYGIRQEVVDVEETDENGNTKIVSKTVNVIDPNTVSIYAKVFDRTNINWSDVWEYNLTFLKCQQNYANDLLKARGHIFLNEVYDMLGIPRTEAGCVTGWVLSEFGDNFVDFGMLQIMDKTYIDDSHCDTIGEQRIDFLNGTRNGAIMLDFNVDGLIYNLI